MAFDSPGVRGQRLPVGSQRSLSKPHEDVRVECTALLGLRPFVDVLRCVHPLEHKHANNENDNNSPIPVILGDSERRHRAPLQEILLDGMDSPLKTQRVLERVLGKLDTTTRSPHACEQELNALLLRWNRKWPAPDDREHFRASVVVPGRIKRGVF